MNTQTDFPAIAGDSVKTGQVVIELRAESTPKATVYVGPTSAKSGAPVEVQKLDSKAFTKKFIGLSYGKDFSPNRWAEAMLLNPKAKFSTAALDHLERILDLETRGSSAAEIGEIIFETFGANVKVPAKFPDRAAAVVAYAVARNAAPPNASKENGTMATKKVTTTTATTEPADTTTTRVKGKAPDAKPAGEFLSEKGKAKLAKQSETAAAKPAAAPKVKKEKKAAEPLTGAFKLTEGAAKVKSPEELRMHEGSTRYNLMAFMFGDKRARTVKGVPVEELVGKFGAETASIIKNVSKPGYEFIVKA